MAVQWFWRRDGRYWALKDACDSGGPVLMKIKQFHGEWIVYTIASEVVDTYPSLEDAQNGAVAYLKEQRAIL